MFLSGDKASDGGAVTTIQATSPTGYSVSGHSTANLDVIAWLGSVGTLSRFDLGGYDDGTACNIWGLVTPGATS